MPPRSPLSKHQQFRVIVLRVEGHSIRKINQEVEFSKSAIARYLDDPTGCKECRRTGRPHKISSRDKRRNERTLQAGLRSSAVLANTL